MTFSSTPKRGTAVNAVVEVFDVKTGRTLERAATGTRGEYTLFAGKGKFRVRATYDYNGQQLVGESNPVLFSGPIGQRATANIVTKKEKKKR